MSFPGYSVEVEAQGGRPSRGQAIRAGQQESQASAPLHTSALCRTDLLQRGDPCGPQNPKWPPLLPDPTLLGRASAFE